MLRKSWRNYLRTCSICTPSLNSFHSDGIVLDSSFQDAEPLSETTIIDPDNVSDQDCHVVNEIESLSETIISQKNKKKEHFVECMLSNQICRPVFVIEKNPMVHRILYVLLFFLFCRRLIGHLV
jgi:hypothetical protein